MVSDYSQKRGTARGRFEASPEVLKVIGVDTLSWLPAELRPLNCQTCFDPLGGISELSADATLATAEVVVSVHHPSCRPSDLRVSRDLVVGRPTVSAKAWVLTEPAPQGHRTGDVVVMLNPSCEQLVLRLKGFLRRRWANVTLDDLPQLGFRPAGRRGPGVLDGVTAQEAGGTLTISAPVKHAARRNRSFPGEPVTIDNTWVVPALSSEIQEALHTAKLLTIAATMQCLPGFIDPDKLEPGLAHRTTLVGQAQLLT